MIKRYIVQEKSKGLDRSIPKVTMGELLAIIKVLKNNKVPGYDEINKANKMFSKNFVKQLLRVINSGLKMSYFPKQWKIAVINQDYWTMHPEVRGLYHCSLCWGKYMKEYCIDELLISFKLTSSKTSSWDSGLNTVHQRMGIIEDSHNSF